MNRKIKPLLKFVLLVATILGTAQAKTDTVSITGNTLRGYTYDSSKLKSYLDNSKQVVIHIYNGGWIKKVLLPETGIEEGSEVVVKGSSAWASNVESSDNIVKVNKENKTFVYKHGSWDERVPTKAVSCTEFSSVGDDTSKLEAYLAKTQEITINIYNGRWIKRLVLPQTGVRENSKVTIYTSASWSTNIETPTDTIRVHKQRKTFVYKNGSWDDRTPTVSVRGSVFSGTEEDSNKLEAYFADAKQVFVSLYNGCWTSNIVLPKTGIRENSELVINTTASWSTNIETSSDTINAHRERKTFIYKHNVWHDITKMRKPKISMLDNSYTISWENKSQMDSYTVYIGDTLYVSDTRYLRKIETYDTSINLANLGTDGKSYYITVIGSTNRLQSKPSDVLKVEKYTTSLKDSDDTMDEFVLNSTITPKALNGVRYTVLETSDVVRHSHDGYYSSDVKIAIEDSHTMTITNTTPRKFKNITFVMNNIGYVINESFEPFQIKKIKTNNIRLNSNDAIEFLDPNPMYSFNLKYYQSTTLDERIDMFQLMQSHFKSFYSSIAVRDDFYTYFTTVKAHTQSQMLAKWYRMMTNQEFIEYKAHSANSAGVASGTWLAIGWPFNKFKDNKEYLYIYGVLSHEYAHTMGFNHSSGLAYGWDNYVQKHIRILMDDETIAAGVRTYESAQVLWSFNKEANTYTAYSTNANAYVLDSLKVILPKGELSNVMVSDNNKLILGLSNDTLNQAVIVNVAFFRFAGFFHSNDIL